MSDPVFQIRNIDAAEKWQQILADLVTDPKELLKILDLDPAHLPLDPQVLESFPLKVPRPFLARMEKGNWQDPLLRQVLPLDQELPASDTLATRDPLGEEDSNPVPGLLHKYHGRVLLTVAPHCAVHCRYCFRRHFDYQRNTPGRQAWQSVIDYIARDPQITEVIYSGGDPLAAGDRQLAWLTASLESIPHLRRLRIHTRTPIMIPQRVTSELLAWLTGTRLRPVLVLHSNHARELDEQVADAIDRLSANGLTLLNQSVLLKGVNDNPQALIELSERLFELGVLPYYLHLLDPVQGVRHFEVSEARGLQLVEQLRHRLPGYLVPRLAREVAGAAAKLTLA
ncbi:MAG: EF-P beta-lysylation protein EpmB [Gammaproteobacteria bacterium]|nr:EF-P beta-lysylation protein EpmB [Pseudomonadales bacterium]MCP5347896.1 EF-P beta-lysylation protein EpmB [Pseudomonadales bacterium]